MSQIDYLHRNESNLFLVNAQFSSVWMLIPLSKRMFSWWHLPKSYNHTQYSFICHCKQHSITKINFLFYNIQIKSIEISQVWSNIMHNWGKLNFFNPLSVFLTKQCVFFSWEPVIWRFESSPTTKLKHTDWYTSAFPGERVLEHEIVTSTIFTSIRQGFVRKHQKRGNRLKTSGRILYLHNLSTEPLTRNLNHYF